MNNRELPILKLKPGREKSLLRRHPWIFSGAVKEITGNPKCGDLVEVRSSKNELLGIIAYSHKSQITGRIWEFNPIKNKNIETLLIEHIASAYELRNTTNLFPSTNSYRLVHAESDQIPGLIVDIYNKTAIMQLLSCGVEVFREEIAEILLDLPEIESVYEQSDAVVRKLEGLPPRSGYVMGKVCEESISIIEHSIHYAFPVNAGQKTGFYLDQRKNRLLLREFVKGKDVLDCFCFSGGFSLNAYMGGANHITSVDSSEDALEALAKNIEFNEFDPDKFDLRCNDVFKELRLYRDQGREFDVIILDPPKFAPTRKQVKRASRGYKDINLLAFKLLRPGGILFTFSCSGGVDPGLFQKIVAGAALDAEADVQILKRMAQDADHPVLLSFPEGEYLKGLICIKK